MSRGASQASPPEVPSTGLILLEAAQARLATLWLALGLFIIIAVVIQSLENTYQNRVGDVWKWLLPTIMPTLTLVLSVLGYSAASSVFSGTMVRKSFYRIAAMLSVFYLVTIAAVIFIQPFVSATVEDKIDSFHSSNLFLGPLQGLVASALGVFFASKQSAAQKEEDGVESQKSVGADASS